MMEPSVQKGYAGDAEHTAPSRGKRSNYEVRDTINAAGQQKSQQIESEEKAWAGLRVLLING